MMTVLREKVEIWLADTDDGVPERDLEILSGDERRRLARIRHSGSRSQFIIGRLLVRRALSLHAPIEPHAWRIEPTHLGRPEIVGPRNAPDLRFSISHAGSLVACALTRGIACGVDIEKTSREVDIRGVARHSFDPAEATRLERLPSPAREEHFFALWTLKEAYVKARGQGIRLRLDSVRFDISRSGLITAATTDDGREPDDWLFSLFEPAPGYLLAVALRRGRSAPHLTFRTFAPSGRATDRDVRRLASSAL